MKILLILIFFSIGQSGFAALSPKKIVELKKSIFEVVVPKKEDLDVVYKDKLPWDQVSFQERNDKYHRLGTAFHIGNGEFVSAAHLFNVELETQWNEFHIRTVEGKVYRLGKFIKYSGYRDLVVFRLKNAPKFKDQLKLSENILVGAVVYTAGNALGEGIVFREGKVTSHTHEPYDGLWKNIRFSAAASPGNSGGPLLNELGEVVGVVAKKSQNENLNHAVPIVELKKMSVKKAVFYRKGLGEFEADKRLMRDWKYESDLPANFRELNKDVARDLHARFRKTRREFVDKYNKELFPRNTKSQSFLRLQPQKDLPGYLNYTSGRWSHGEFSWKQVNYIDGRKIYYAQRNKSALDYHVVIERPKNLSAQKFLDQPKKIHDIMLTKLQYFRKFAGLQVYVLSMGNVDEVLNRKDRYGREWKTFLWRTAYNNATTYLSCHSIPFGVSCFWGAVSTSLEVSTFYNLEHGQDRVILTYFGSLSDWKSYYKIGRGIPDFLKDSAVTFKDKEMLFRLGSLKTTSSHLKLNEKSFIVVPVEYSVKRPNQMVVGGLKIYPKEDLTTVYNTYHYYSPADDSPDSHRDAWKAIQKRNAPYNSEISRSDGANTIVVAKNEKKEKVQVFSCAANDDLKPEQLKRNCLKFSENKAFE